ncbi:MAG: DUF1638 domain-containing protein [Verrucomicrobiota bacterium]|nr:DUF1638 domain-containing protein [Verrucomicrobiota bacterium]
MQFKLISCEIFFREMEFLAGQVPHQIDVEFLQKGLHDIPSDEMTRRIQAQVDAASEQDYDAILLGYGLCNNGLDGIHARNVQLVLPRAHDCIALFFGSRQRYREYFDANPGAYFKTTGWIERDEVADELKQLSIPHQTGMDMTYGQLVEKHGEDNAEFLWEELCNTEKNYSQITFIEMGVEPDGSFENTARGEAASKHWKFEKVPGNLTLLRRLLNGDWDDGDFLIVPPHHKTIARHDELIVSARSED